VPHPALFLQMRLGKTLVTLRYLYHKYDFKRPILIVAPYSALDSWTEEILNEGYTHKDINYLTGERSERFKRIQKLKTFNLINKEGFLHLPEIASMSIDWGCSILDESTFIKNHKALVSNFYADNFNNVEKRFILTGTPMPESELDIFMQLQYLNKSILPFNNFYEFRYNLFTQGTRTKRNWIITTPGRKFLTSRLSKHCLIMTRNDVNIPERKVYEKRKIKMPVKTRVAYNTLAKEFLIEYENSIIKVTDFAATKWVWLRQMCSGYVTNDNGNTTQLNDVKNNEVIDLMRGELKQSQVIIWCVYTHEIIRLKRLLMHNDIYTTCIFGQIPIPVRNDRRKDFNKGNIQVIICQPECFKFGSNLSSADVSIYFSSPLGTTSRDQSESRMEDVSSQDTDLVVDLVTENTLEEDIYYDVKNKISKQKLLLRVIKRMYATIK
jgi:SNF2 family DNA or RNA helicase